jgi:hypothetical protein
MVGSLFTGVLSKFGAKVQDEDVISEFVISHASKNQSSEDFLDTFSEKFHSNIGKCLNDPEWDSIKFSVNFPNMIIKFDEMEIKADLVGIRISQKDTAKDHIVKYDLTFVKKQEKDVDIHFSTYLKHKDEDENGKKSLTLYDVEISR